MTKITEKQFLEMAERERDAWIDKHVVGIECRHADGTLLDEVNLSWQCSCGAKGEGFSSVCTSLPYYSKDANAMMRIIDHMEDLHYAWIIDFDLVARNVYFIHPDSEKKYWGQWGNPLTVQVPLAAGRAIGAIE